MEFYVSKSGLDQCGEALLAVGLAEDREKLPPAVVRLDEALGGAIAAVLDAGDFRGKKKEIRTVHCRAGDGAPERVVLVGLGKRADLDPEVLRRAAAEAALEAKKLRTGRIAFALPFADGLPVDEQARAIVEASTLALYEFRRFLSKEPEDRVAVERLTLVSHDDTDEDEIGPAVSLGRIAADCENFCRDLGNTPAGVATPTWMAERAAAMAGEFGLAVTVIDRPEMEESKMGGLLGVAQGSAEPPKMVVLEHNAGRKDLPTICLVGKGVTFDSGGISIKPAQNMHEMKFDKCGACAVIGAMRAAAMLDLPLHVVGITPFAENMPGGAAYRPGDVLEISNGKTIEVLNTDAEGRLLLADGLVKAASYAPDAVVDLATLTGACMIALGQHCAGLMSPDDGLAAKLFAAGERSGERVWRLPLYPEYREQLESSVADMTNLGGRFGGAITAAALLKEFAGEGAWAHLDIAGVAWRDSDRDYLRKGGTGFGVRLLVEFLRNWQTGE